MRLASAFILILLFDVQAQNTTLHYPAAAKVELVENLHGFAVSDPYRWMEEMQSEKVKEWVSTQDQLLKEELHNLPVYARVKARISELNAYTRYGVPVKVGKKYFYTETPPLGSKPLLYVQKGLNGKPVVLLDPDKAFPNSDIQLFAGTGSSGGSGFYPSPDRTSLAYSFSKGLSRWYSIKLLDLSTTEVNSNEELVGLHSLGGAIAWSKNGSGFFYIRFDLPDKNADLLKSGAINGAVYFHKKGTPQRHDKMIYKKDDDGAWTYSVKVTDDGKYLIIETRNGSKSENHILYQKLDPDSNPVLPLLESRDALYSFLGNSGEEFYFFTNLNAPNGKIVGFRLGQKEFYDIISESDETISGASLTGGNALGFFGNHFVITYIQDGKPYFKGFDKAGTCLFTTRLPNGGTIWGNFRGSGSDKEVFFNYFNLMDASVIYKLDVSTGALTLFKQARVNFDSVKYITDHVFYRSTDGTMVPMFVTHRKGITLDGNNPAFIYGYGALNWISILFYQEHLLLWLEMGGVYAQPSIRGGGEYGEKWHKSGMGHNRQNAIDDYLSAAQWLIDSKYSSPKKIIANGGSLSAALAGEAMLQRPDLFGACIVDRPAMDMVRFTMFTNGRSWVGEFGDPENAEDFKILYKLSPYHQIKRGICYPPTLIMAGDQDQTTPPAHAYKFAAAMQANNGNCNNPVLLKMMWGAGHTFGSTRDQVIDSRTDEVMFLIKVLGLEWKLQ